MDGYGFTSHNLRRVERHVFEMVDEFRFEDLISYTLRLNPRSVGSRRIMRRLWRCCLWRAIWFVSIIVINVALILFCSSPSSIDAFGEEPDVCKYFFWSFARCGTFSNEYF